MIIQRRVAGVVGTFAHVDALVAAIDAVRAARVYRFRVHSPVPRHEILDALFEKTSPVRVWTLTGALTGLASAVALTVWTGIKMHAFGGLLVGGKPVTSWPAYMVIMFELTVLLGSLFTFGGFLFHARLPNIFVDAGYRPEFTDDTFGVFLQCHPDQLPEAAELMRRTGALEVRVVEKT